MVSAERTGLRQAQALVAQGRRGPGCADELARRFGFVTTEIVERRGACAVMPHSNPGGD